MKKMCFHYPVMLCFLFWSFTVVAQVNFASSNLTNFTIANPTTLQFGPDGRLYVAQQDGTIKIFTIQKNASNAYAVTATETILLVKQIPNHYDDGTLKPFNIQTNKRQVTGLYVTGTASNLVIYVCSADSDMGGGTNGDKNLCTNSGIISKLTWNGTQWQKIDLVRGIPRSEENHSPNGIQVDETNQILYLAVGGLTNAGSASKFFAYISEYVLSAAVLSIDLQAIEAMPVKDAMGLHPYKYDIPTLDDPTRSNNSDGSDLNDPFGGNDGLNMGKIIPGGPVQVFIPGLRNAYDMVITKTPGRAGRMYIIDNAANPNWGGYPENEGTTGTVTNNYVPGEPGSLSSAGGNGVVNNLDVLHKIDLTNYTPGSYYGGHPCPLRANPSGAGLYTHTGTLETGTGVWRTSTTDLQYPLPADWPPVPLNMAQPIQGDYQNPGESNQALLTFDVSTNGLCEYTASNFGGALKGDLFAINFEGVMYRIKLAPDGSVLNSKGSKKLNQDMPFASGFGAKGLDITTQGDNGAFPGTIWVVNYASNSITVFEPGDIACAGTNSSLLDEDGDGYKNADEIDNGTNPCSAASKPEDNDTDLISDLNDSDDDNDNVPDNSDPFALDKFNGSTTNIPLSYSLFNNDPGTGFFGLGFTGLMSNGVSDYLTLYKKENLVAGGAIGAFTIDKVSAGDAKGNFNNQDYAFQFGVNVNSRTGPFMVRGVMLGGFFNGTAPANFQSQGIYIGNGDQDNYLKVALNANNGQGGIEVLLENQGVVTSSQYNISSIPASTAELIISVDPSIGKADIKVALDGGSLLAIGNTLNLSGPLLQCIQGSSALAVGIISTSRNAATFNATWDLIEVKTDPFKVKGEWNFITSSDGSLSEGRYENGFVQCGDRFYLLGGRGIKNVSEYDPLLKTWKLKAKPPIELSHFQAVAFDNLIYVIGAFTGGYPNEVPVPDIYIYNPAVDKWIKGRSIPAERRRGSAGAVVHNNKIYIASGITNGHQSGFVPWLDEYDPSTNEWKILPDAPRSRDHFNAVVNGSKLYMAGGRRSSGATGQVFNLTVPEVDIFDFATNSWTTNPNNIPTMRAGTAAVPLNDEVIVIGGESMAHLKAHNETEALNIFTGQWRTLDTLNNGRHATQAIVNNGGIYITGGSSGRGGSAASELTTAEEFFLTVKSPPVLVALVRSGLEVPATKDLGVVASGTGRAEGIIIKNVDGNQGIMISNIKLKNNSGNLFSFQSPYTFPYFIAPGKNAAITVGFNSINNLPASAELVIVHTGKGDSTVIALKANQASEPPPTSSPSAWTPLYFINAGGASLISGSSNWQEDTQTMPSSYSNQAATFNKTSTVAYTGNNNTDAPTVLFNSYRWDGGTKGNPLTQEMLWKFPAETGWYKVDLYFAESYAPHNISGKRVFDIMIEDTIRADNFDIVAEAGFKNAIKKSYEVYVKDGFIHIYFLHEIQNPLVNGIAVFKKNAAATAQINPVALDYGSQILNTSGTKAVTVKNTGSSSLTLTQVNIAGQNASDFTHNFSGQVVVPPGAEKVINVVFKPVTSGNKVASLKIYSPDLTDTLNVALAGQGLAGSSLVFITKPTDGEMFSVGDSVNIEASASTGAGAYLKVNCPDGNFRKLKIGYSPTNIFNPPNNVIAGGNSAVEIVIKSLTQNINWNKIQIRPQGNTATPVVIGNYMSSAEPMSDGYVKIIIPLSAFNSGINFSQITFIEFPYSAGAGIFEVYVQSIVFTGGTSSFVWFGNSKTDNKHDGAGGGGQLLASLVSGSSRSVTQVLFYQNNILLGVDNSAPYTYTWKNVAQGNYGLTAKAIFSDGLEEISNPVAIAVNASTYAGMRVVVVFDQVPQNYSVSNATLKYDKDFAYSFTLDDGKDDAYTRAYPLFNGGHIAFNNTTYPGLFYTDGCGNNFPFRAGLAWNSQNASGVDPHIKTPGYLTWDQLNYLRNNGWNIFNHSLTHKTGTGTDYNFQVVENSRILKDKTGLNLRHFVIPSGDINYESPAFNNGMVTVYNQSGNYPGANGGLKVDGNLNLNNFKLNRKFLNDGKHDTSNVTEFIDQVAAKSINGNHFWYNDFTHKVSETSSGGSLIFSTFEHYMKYVEKKYGKSGKDNIWMAPLEDVYEYLAVRNNIRYTTQLKGNRLEIYFDTTDVSPDLLKHALTLKISSDQNFSNIEATGFSWTSHRGTGNNKIINLEWDRNNYNARMAGNFSDAKSNEEVLYRINLGGPTLYSPAGTWHSDSSYLYANKTIIIRNTETITLDAIPEKTPHELFSSDRSTEKDSLSWNFPVDEGGEVEVRLYFAETYFEETNKRVFDVAIENTVTLSDFDIVAEAGKNKAIMKSFKTTSDGTLDINLIKIKHNPSISGMEIICLNNRCNSKKLIMSGAEWSQDKISASAYPNPFADKLMVNFTTDQPEKVSVRIYNSVGEVLKEVEVSLSNNSEIQMDLSGLPTGVYFMKIMSGEKVNETIKVIKQ